MQDGMLVAMPMPMMFAEMLQANGIELEESAKEFLGAYQYDREAYEDSDLHESAIKLADYFREHQITSVSDKDFKIALDAICPGLLPFC